jgi:hypothetical protein
MSLFKKPWKSTVPIKPKTTVTLFRSEPLGAPSVKKTPYNINLNPKRIPRPGSVTHMFTLTEGRKTKSIGTHFGGRPQTGFGGLLQIKKVKVPVKILSSVDQELIRRGWSTTIYQANLPYKYIKKAKVDPVKTIIHNLKLGHHAGRRQPSYINPPKTKGVYQFPTKVKDIIKNPFVKKVAKKVAVRTALAASGVGTAAAVALTAHDIYSGSKWLYKKYKK